MHLQTQLRELERRHAFERTTARTGCFFMIAGMLRVIAMFIPVVSCRGLEVLAAPLRISQNVYHFPMIIWGAPFERPAHRMCLSVT